MGIIGNSHPLCERIVKDNKKKPDHPWFLLELPIEFRSGLATMMPFVTKDIYRSDRLPRVSHKTTYSPYWLAFWNHTQAFHGASSWVVEVGQKANHYGEYEQHPH